MNVLEHFRNARTSVALGVGVEIFREGDAPDFMYVLMEGMADVLVGNTPVELATPGAILGEMALIDNSPRSASVRCRTPCRLVSINVAQFDLLIRESPAFARHVMTVMSERLRRMNEGMMTAFKELQVRV